MDVMMMSPAPPLA